jgi:hypothetical protein
MPSSVAEVGAFEDNHAVAPFDLDIARGVDNPPLSNVMPSSVADVGAFEDIPVVAPFELDIARGEDDPPLSNVMPSSVADVGAFEDTHAVDPFYLDIARGEDDPPLANARKKRPLADDRKKRLLAITEIVRECATQQNEQTKSRDALIVRVMEEVANKYPSEDLNTGEIQDAWTIGILLTNCSVYFI